MDVSSLRLTDLPEGCRLSLRVRAGSRREGIVGTRGEALKIAVNAAPERGRANRAVLDLLARVLGIAPSRLRLLGGETTADKTVLVEGTRSEDLRLRLSAL